MKKAVDKKIYFALALNVLIVVLEVFAVLLSYKNHGLGMLFFYTEDSNIFALIACLILSFLIIKYLITGKEIPNYAKTLKYMATCCLTVTFIVVLLVLAPMYGPKGYEIMLFQDSMLYHHLICPVLAIISYVFFEKANLTKKNTLYAVIPTIVYAITLLLLNLLKVYVGPYPFLHVYEQPIYMSIIWFVVILGGAYLIALFLKILKRQK